MTIARSRLVQLGALIGAVVVGAAIYYLVGGLAGGLYAAAALVFGLIAHFKLKSSEEKAPKSSEPSWNRWGRKRAQVEDLQQALETERAVVAERDTHVEVLRRELEEQRQLARSLEGHYLHELAAQEEAHAAESARISAAVAELEDELAAFDAVVDDLVHRATPAPPVLVESSYGGTGYSQF